jgi:hypothetical protein
MSKNVDLSSENMNDVKKSETILEDICTAAAEENELGDGDDGCHGFHHCCNPLGDISWNPNSIPLANQGLE